MIYHVIYQCQHLKGPRTGIWIFNTLSKALLDKLSFIYVSSSAWSVRAPSLSIQINCWKWMEKLQTNWAKTNWRGKERDRFHWSMCVKVCGPQSQCDENKNLNGNINRNTGRFIVGRRAELRSTMSLQLVLSSVTNQQYYYPGPT